MDHQFWYNKTVLVTGHTGFKGSWLSLWLQQLGARVIGFSLSVPTTPSLFELANVSQEMVSIIGDIRDRNHILRVIQHHQPNIIFHLAAQPLVRHSYQEPVDTYLTNVMGTTHLLEAVRQTLAVKVIVNVTSDKCYQNQEWYWGYRENEALGGYDPYSSSKACSELISASYRESFFKHKNIALATARAGNVIGGGDWAQDRLMTDIINAVLTQQPFILRYPHAIRPWQHVLDPLAGYLRLAQKLWEEGSVFAEAWNFGPQETKTVEWMVEHFLSFFQYPPTWSVEKTAVLHEAQLLKLDSTKAQLRLNWKPKLDTLTALKWVADWVKAYQQKQDLGQFTQNQILQFQGLTRS